METTRKRMFHTIALAAALTVTGCAGPPKDHPTLQAMKALGTAGFDLKMADTPAKLERIKQLPQLQLAQVEHKGRQVYVFTDAQGCQCLYAGDENAYRRLINLRYSKRETSAPGGLRTIATGAPTLIKGNRSIGGM